MTKKELLHTPIIPLEVKGDQSVAELLEKMEDISFQGRNLAHAFRIWREMLRDETVILMGLAGAMVPAGMRKVIAYLIQNRFIDCLVSTGANLFHDCTESLGRCHYKGDPRMDDTELLEVGLDRIYDTLADNQDFLEVDEFIRNFASELDSEDKYTTKEFFHLLGKKLKVEGTQEGILTSAAQSGVPIYCPAIGDSSFGIALSLMESRIYFDVVKDVWEMASIVAHAERTGIIFVGGGTPKNFIQQSEITARELGWRAPGHYYAIQITTDAPHWGGLSGCTFTESHSWGKIARGAQQVTVYCDATVALPFLVTALAEDREGLIRDRKPSKLWP